MKATQQLHDLGQSLWLDNITRGLLTDGTLRRYIDELSVTGLTSNPSIFDHAIKNSNFYDVAIHQKMKQGKSGEALFFELAIEDLRQAADLFRPIYDRTNGIDGWVSIEVSPTLAYDTAGTIAEVKQLRSCRAAQPLRQDSRYSRRYSRDRGVYLCGRAGECDPALFARAISGSGGSLFARHRATHPSRIKS